MTPEPSAVFHWDLVTLLSGGRVRIIQTSTQIAILHEDLAYRVIHLDGRALPESPHPTFMGYSVGRWRGDTLEVENVGFNDQTWLDYGGHPHTDKLRIIERFRRTNFGRIEREVTLIDPELYVVPITVNVPLAYMPDTDLLEYVCAENPKSRPHLIGRTAAEKRVVVPASVLETYTGTYEVVGRADLGITNFTVSVAGGQLFVALNGRGRIPMVPLSSTMFSPRLLGTYEFVTDSAKRVTHVLTHAAEGTYRFNRRPESAR